MNEKKSMKDLLREKAEQAKKIAKDPNVKAGVKDLWKSLKDLQDSMDVMK